MAKNKDLLSHANYCGNVAFNELMTIKEQLKEQEKALLSSFGVDHWEDLPEGEARATGAQLEDLIHIITFRAESLSEWLDKLEEVDLSGF